VPQPGAMGSEECKRQARHMMNPFKDGCSWLMLMVDVHVYVHLNIHIIYINICIYIYAYNMYIYIYIHIDVHVDDVVDELIDWSGF
jgi:hypothetical protein